MICKREPMQFFMNACCIYVNTISPPTCSHTNTHTHSHVHAHALIRKSHMDRIARELCLINRRTGNTAGTTRRPQKTGIDFKQICPDISPSLARSTSPELMRSRLHSLPSKTFSFMPGVRKHRRFITGEERWRCVCVGGEYDS